MKFSDVIATASRNVFRSKLRTTLTVLAVVVGAFTLTLTQSLGTGVTAYLDDQAAALGADNVLIIAQQPEERGPDDGPAEYRPENSNIAFGSSDGTYTTLKGTDLATIEGVDGLTSVLPVRMLAIDYIAGNGGIRYEFAWSATASATKPPLVAGNQLDHDTDRTEVLLTKAYAEALGFDDYSDAVGSTVRIGISDATGNQHEVTAQVAGVGEDTLFAAGIGVNERLSDTLAQRQHTGALADAGDRYPQAIAFFDASASAEAVESMRERLAHLGYEAKTVEDQMGEIKTVIDVIIAVLSGFAVIALIAAGFGIVNTLLMSVQERTREIGLMKALGMGSRRVFGLFSMEAVSIGLLGSALGVGLAILAGTGLNGLLSDGMLVDLPGLTLLVFEPVGVLMVMAVVGALAFLAGTVPAARAARQNPIDALRYE